MNASVVRPMLCLFAASALAACATASSYRQRQDGDVGWRQIKLQENVWRVDYEGGPDMDLSVAKDLALLRAAELALESGAPYFVVEESDTETRTRVWGSAAVRMHRHSWFPGDVDSSVEPFATYTVRLLRDRGEAGSAPLVYAAEEVAANLRTRYNLASPGGQTHGTER